MNQDNFSALSYALSYMDQSAAACRVEMNNHSATRVHRESARAAATAYMNSADLIRAILRTDPRYMENR